MVAIDMHVHPLLPGVFEKYAPSFWGHLAPKTFGHPVNRAFTLDQLLRDMDEGDVERSVVVGIDCSTVGGWRVPNEDVADVVRKAPDRLIGFAGCDPHKGEQATLDLTYAIKELGLAGLKLHTPTQQFYADDPRHEPMWSVAEALGIPVLAHVGHTFAGGARLKFTNPVYYDAVLADHPDLVVMFAHFGFPFFQEAVSICLTRPNAYLELSGWSPVYIPEFVWTYVRAKLSDRTLFGTDYPDIKPSRFVRDLDLVDLTEEMKHKILYANAARVLGLDGGNG